MQSISLQTIALSSPPRAVTHRALLPAVAPPCALLPSAPPYEIRRRQARADLAAGSAAARARPLSSPSLHPPCSPPRAAWLASSSAPARIRHRLSTASRMARRSRNSAWIERISLGSCGAWRVACRDLAGVLLDPIPHRRNQDAGVVVR